MGIHQNSNKKSKQLTIQESISLFNANNNSVLLSTDAGASSKKVDKQINKNAKKTKLNKKNTKTYNQYNIISSLNLTLKNNNTSAEVAVEGEAEAQHQLQSNNNDIIPLQSITRYNPKRLTPAKRHASDTDFETPPNKLREPRRWNPIIPMKQLISNQITGFKRKIDSSYHFPNTKMKTPRWIINQQQHLKRKKRLTE